MLMGAHAPGDALHDDTETLYGHCLRPLLCRLDPSSNLPVASHTRPRGQTIGPTARAKAHRRTNGKATITSLHSTIRMESPLFLLHAARSRPTAFSAIMMVGALVLPPIRVGMAEASTT